MHGYGGGRSSDRRRSGHSDPPRSHYDSDWSRRDRALREGNRGETASVRFPPRSPGYESRTNNSSTSQQNSYLSKEDQSHTSPKKKALGDSISLPTVHFQSLDSDVIGVDASKTTLLTHINQIVDIKNAYDHSITSDLLKSLANSSVPSESHDFFHYIIHLIAQCLLPNVVVMDSDSNDHDSLIKTTAALPANPPTTGDQENITDDSQSRNDNTNRLTKKFPSLSKALVDVSFGDNLESLFDDFVNSLPLAVVKDICGANSGGVDFNRKQNKAPKITTFDTANMNIKRLESVVEEMRSNIHCSVTRRSLELIDQFSEYIDDIVELEKLKATTKKENKELESLLNILSKHETIIKRLRLRDDDLLRKRKSEINRQQVLQDTEVEILTLKESNLTEQNQKSTKEVMSLIKLFENASKDVSIPKP